MADSVALESLADAAPTVSVPWPEPHEVEGTEPDPENTEQLSLGYIEAFGLRWVGSGPHKID